MDKLSQKKYNIIYADPPWPIKIISKHVRPKQLDMPYNIMTVEDIKNLPVQKITDKNECHLFLWATHKYLPVAFDVVEAWGFKYHCTLTWDKTYGFTPFSFMWSTEFCLYGQLKNKWVEPARIGIKTLIKEKPTEHSKKPQAMYRLIEEYAGDEAKKIELFARKDLPMFPKREGWDWWGNEVESDIEL